MAEFIYRQRKTINDMWNTIFFREGNAIQVTDNADDNIAIMRLGNGITHLVKTIERQVLSGDQAGAQTDAVIKNIPAFTKFKVRNLIVASAGAQVVTLDYFDGTNRKRIAKVHVPAGESVPIPFGFGGGPECEGETDIVITCTAACDVTISGDHTLIPNP